MTDLIHVDYTDKVLGRMDKVKAHQGKSILHRAFSVVVVNDYGEILLQQRSKYKTLWPLYWSNTCCSHPVFHRHSPLDEESIKKQAEKRLKEEMGFTLSLKPIFKFYYQAKYKDIGSENELVTVLLGRYQGGKIEPDPKEVTAFKWIKYKDLLKEMNQEPKLFTPWFKKMVKNINFIRMI